MSLTQDSNSFELHSELVGLIKHSKRSFVATGKLLYELKSNGGYKEAVGQGIDTWNDYIAQPEINLSITEAERLMQIYEQFILRFNTPEEVLSNVPIKNLKYLLPIAKQTKNDVIGILQISTLVDAANYLSQRDFKARVDEIKLKDIPLTYEYLLMKRCKETGSLVKIHEYSSPDIEAMISLYGKV